ncbi:hypothetical protein GCM10009854_47180 [Saccharopolyspora halophila]|uniref:Cardiolipin synthase N-terminal domain-containing protein n=1 Tax=Saccharopolyspora halophila TaxID=405551 RepID=A0ABN3GVE6_9PSEU
MRVWAVILVALSGLVVTDLVVVGRRPHEAGIREPGSWVVGYVALAAIFGGLPYAFAGSLAVRSSSSVTSPSTARRWSTSSSTSSSEGGSATSATGSR